MEDINIKSLQTGFLSLNSSNGLFIVSNTHATIVSDRMLKRQYLSLAVGKKNVDPSN